MNGPGPSAMALKAARNALPAHWSPLTNRKIEMLRHEGAPDWGAFVVESADIGRCRSITGSHEHQNRDQRVIERHSNT